MVLDSAERDPSFRFSPGQGTQRALGCSLIDTSSVLEALKLRKIPLHEWPEGDDGLSGLVEELATGMSELRWMPSERRLFRRIRLVRMHLRAQFDGTTHDLFEDHQICLTSGEVRRRWKGKLPSETLEQGESPEQGFVRGLREELHMTVRQVRRVRILHAAWRPVIEPGQGRSFPGLETQYYIWDFWAQLPPSLARRQGYIEDHGGRRTFLVWRPDTPAVDESVDALCPSSPA